jgi:outer membrane protein OmpA-like peptidoglycan-associated protein
LSQKTLATVYRYVSSLQLQPALKAGHCYYLYVMFIQAQFLCKVLFLIVLFICKTSPGSCQANFLLNGDFENINNCKEFNAECGVEAWFYLKDVKVQMMNNEAGTGVGGANSFAIFYNWAGYKDFTPIIGTILPCSLQKGKQYIFKGWISAKLDPKLILKPGICTGPNFYVPRRAFSKEMKPDSILQIKQVAETPFFEFEYRFIATGDEDYLTFGTYVTEDSLNGKKLSGLQTVSLLLDNFSLVSADPLETFCGAYKDNKEKIYEYNFRHKEMDYTLYAKGKLPVELTGNKEDNLTRFEALRPAPIKPDTLKLGDVLFDFNKADLKGNATKMLETFFKDDVDKRTIDSIYIEGHTDSVGSDDRNIGLSQQRSEAVMKWLISNNIVANARIAVHPFGRSRPVAFNKTPAGRALNRRVEVIVFRRQ